VTSIGDSFTVPGFGYVAFRFTAKNPGPWFFHCHVEWHLGLGMALILSVENDDGTYPNIGPIPSQMLSQCCAYIKYVTQDTMNAIFKNPVFIGVLIIALILLVVVIFMAVYLKLRRKIPKFQENHIKRPINNLYI